MSEEIQEQNNIEEISIIKENNNIEQKETKKRYPIFDNLRGIIIFIAVIISLEINIIPYYITEHAPPYLNTVRFIDIGVVSFIAILSILFSYNIGRKCNAFKETYKSKINEEIDPLIKKKKERRDKIKGYIDIYKHYIIRSFIFIGFGFTWRFFEDNFIMDNAIGIVQTTSFNIFVSYGFMILFSLPFIRLKPYIKTIIGFVFIYFHQFVLLNNGAISEIIDANSQGGFYSLFAWVGICLIIGAIGDYYFKSRKKFTIVSIVYIALGVLYVILNVTIKNDDIIKQIYLNKKYVTAGYLFVSLGVTLIAFILFDRIKYLREKEIPLFATIGQNSFLFYVIGSSFGIILDLIFGKMVYNENVAMKYIGNILEILISAGIILALAYLISRIRRKKKS